MKLLVTGGAGFIGSAVIRLAIQEGLQVVNVDKLTYAANLDNLRDVADNPDYAFVQADICDRAAMADIFRTHQPESVMHLAAESHVDRSIDGPRRFHRDQYRGRLCAVGDGAQLSGHALRQRARAVPVPSCVDGRSIRLARA